VLWITGGRFSATSIAPSLLAITRRIVAVTSNARTGDFWTAAALYRQPPGDINATTIATGIDLRAARVRLRRWQGRSEPSAETGSTQPMCLFK